MLGLLTGLAMGAFGVGIMALVWSIRSGQFDDLETPAQRMLGDDPAADPLDPSQPH